MIELLGYGFVQRALIAGILVGVLCGVLGFFVVLKRLSFIGVGISHSAFGGIAIGVLAEAGDYEGPRAWRMDETTSYAESFREELVHFHDCVCTGSEPATSGTDALRDVALCQAVVAAHRDRLPRDRPTVI